MTCSFKQFAANEGFWTWRRLGCINVRKIVYLTYEFGNRLTIATNAPSSTVAKTGPCIVQSRTYSLSVRNELNVNQYVHHYRSSYSCSYIIDSLCTYHSVSAGEYHVIPCNWNLSTMVVDDEEKTDRTRRRSTGLNEPSSLILYYLHQYRSFLIFILWLKAVCFSSPSWLPKVDPLSPIACGLWFQWMTSFPFV